MNPHPPVVFQHTVQTLLRALEPELDEACAQRLREVGIEVREPVDASYPLHTWVAALRIAGEALRPGASVEEGTREVGRRFVERYGWTVVGRATLTLAKVLGPERTMRRMTHNFRTGNNYTHCELEQLGPRRFHLRIRPVNVPGFHMGVIEAGLRLSGATAVDVHVHSREGALTVFEVRWD